MRFGICTDSGHSRPTNQDAYGYRGGFFLVADGMGGHRGGEVASRIAVELILAAAEGKEPVLELHRGFAVANQAIRDHASLNPDCQGMGTTVAVLALVGNHACLAHIGDSRVYRSREGALELLTRDHTLVEELVRQGSLSAEEARNHPQRSLLTRALGTTASPEVEYAEVDLRQGDIFLLCTDGLTTEVPREEIEAVLVSVTEPQAKAESLVDLANQQGGSDNITVFVVAYEA